MTRLWTFTGSKTILDIGLDLNLELELDNLSDSLQLNFLVELLKPNHENCLFGLDLFELAPVHLDRAVFVGLRLEVADEAHDELVHDGPGVLLLDDVVQALQIISQGESELFKSETNGG